ncbi:hypothetical protein V5799_000783 [Amblyomma americanum]|uniref:Regulator of G-protein signaling 7 n=1 Tax=Amblyomma americanum TaxID=6943 RepID=A0AAQ4D222_AMBAM
MEGKEPPDESCCKEPVLAKMEALVREMQHPDTGVPVRSQKLFLTSIPSAFLGYDVVEWLTDNLDIEDQNPVAAEALHLANLLCQYGYFFPVSDNAKTFAIRDDSTLYRFQTPYFWPSRYQPDNTDYAIYLCKRALKNKPKYALEEYEQEALQRLKKLLYHKWEFICMQAQEQAALAKERKKTDKLILQSQERAYWRIHRPPPGCTSCLEKSPVPNKRGPPKKKTKDDLKREIEILKRNLARSRTKVSQILARCEQYQNFDSFIVPPYPGNPWITDEPTLWALESSTAEVPTERRLQRWNLSLEELLADPMGAHEFEQYLRTEYSHENILFWKAVQDLRHGSQQEVPRKVAAIYEEFLCRGAPCEVNLDSETLERTQQEAHERPTRFSLDAAQHHVFALMKKDTYTRFTRSEHFRRLMAKAQAMQQAQGQRKRFFHFGSSTKKKSVCGPLVGALPANFGGGGVPGNSLVNVGASTSAAAAGGGGAMMVSGITTSATSPSATARAPSGRPLSGSTVDLRNTSERRDDVAGAGVGVAGGFSGRHSHSTSDLHKLEAPSCSPHGHVVARFSWGSQEPMDEDADSSTLKVPRWSHRASDPEALLPQLGLQLDNWDRPTLRKSDIQEASTTQRETTDACETNK